jgi:hypothetical protein
MIAVPAGGREQGERGFSNFCTDVVTVINLPDMISVVRIQLGILTEKAGSVS